MKDLENKITQIENYLKINPPANINEELKTIKKQIKTNSLDNLLFLNILNILIENLALSYSSKNWYQKIQFLMNGLISDEIEDKEKALDES